MERGGIKAGSQRSRLSKCTRRVAKGAYSGLFRKKLLSPSKDDAAIAATKPIQNTKEKRSIAVQWEGKESLISGYMELTRKSPGKINFTIPDSDGKCSGMFSYSRGEKGV